MQRIGDFGSRHGSRTPRSKVTTVVGLAGVSLFFLVGFQVARDVVARAVTPATSDTGFTSPFSGTPRHQHLAPTEITNQGQLNRPIGTRVADRLAAQLGLSKANTFTKQQYRLFVTGKGVGGNLADAKIVDQSARIFTNTTGRPLLANVNGQITRSVLASYGLFVNRSGLL
jgi:hypothetical protein